jgi:G6PDH family F420-dependent oxidoreductase
MPSYGLKLMTEIHGPGELVRQAVTAEEAGFDFVGISDHFHPWLEDQGHAPSAWTVLGAIAQATERIRLVTMVTCPIKRYHPAVVAQLAATTAVLSDGRFVLGVGTGELLNEHVVGGEWPSIDIRQEQLGEAIEAMQLLFEGGYQSYRGEHVEVVDARLFDLPEQPVPIVVAAGGPQAATLAGEVGDGLVVIEPESSLLDAFTDAGGDRAMTFGEVGLAWDRDEGAARDAAHRRARFSVLGWKVLPELPNVGGFEDATAHVTPEMVAHGMPCGPDVEAHAEAVRAFVDAGYEHVAMTPLGDDVDGFFRFWQEELRPALP